MIIKELDRLINRGVLTREDFEHARLEAAASGMFLEDALLSEGVPKHELLFCLAEYYGYPFAEYDESVVVAQAITRRLDLERLKHALWLPLSITPGKAEVIACRPDDPAALEDICTTVNVQDLTIRVALPSDLIRIIEHNQDLNPGFPPPAGRTPLAKARTFLADRRSLMACYRTSLAKGRTGLAFFRTGISFITISFVLFRIFGIGYLAIAEALLFVAGMLMVLDGMRWYLPARKAGRKILDCKFTMQVSGTSVLDVVDPGDDPVFKRSDPVDGAEILRRDWSTLSPVMRRRFLASDRTDLAEERTVLACLRTTMARARTGLSFTRTGISSLGLGIVFIRQFPPGLWTTAGVVLIAIGTVKVLEGFWWYFPGRRAGREGSRSITQSEDGSSIWDVMFPPTVKSGASGQARHTVPPVKGFDSPGIWATTGLALERTLLAERRNVMARLRTIMARSRTGMAFIRTGMSLAVVGLGLLVYFGAGSTAWAVFDVALIAMGLLFIADGIYWYVPAEKTRKQFPYCFGELEIAIPDYGKPGRAWGKAVFSHDDA